MIAKVFLLLVASASAIQIKTRSTLVQPSLEETFAFLDKSGDGCIDRAEAQVFVSMLPKDEQPADEAEFNAGFDKVAGGDECVDLADAMKEFA